MKVALKLKHLAPDLWMMTFPLTVLGVDLQRNVTILKLSSGKLVIHSTAPFTPADVEVIHKLGEPAWLADVLLRHDTFAAQGHAAFPQACYLAPDGFEAEGVTTLPLVPAPDEWAGEVEVAPIMGAPAFSEIVMLHRASRTLIVGDLLFNFEGTQDLLTKVFLKVGAVGGKHDPGMTRPFRNAIEDEAAFADSIRGILEWDFDRVIVGHGVPIRTGGKEKLRATFHDAGIAGL
ncbi:MAG: hypothetical protein V4584_16550 [Verrucomicrobiota bacterium]